MAEFEEAGGYLGFTLEYQLVPGVPAVDGGGNLFRFLVGVSYAADSELPWWPNDGGAIAPFEGGDATHGFRGDWPLPPDAKVLTFSLASRDQAGFADSENPAGALVVDLARGTAVCRSAESVSGHYASSRCLSWLGLTIVGSPGARGADLRVAGLPDAD
jgi:hypothetical protein